MSIDTENTRKGLEQAKRIAIDSRNDRHRLVGSEVRQLVMLARTIAAERDTAEAEVERLRTRLAEVEAERDRLHEALSRWGRWCHSPDGMGGDLFDAAVEGTPATCFPADVPR